MVALLCGPEGRGVARAGNDGCAAHALLVAVLLLLAPSCRPWCWRTAGVGAGGVAGVDSGADVAVVKLTVGRAVGIPLIELVLIVVAVLMLVPAPDVTVLLEALLVSEALGVDDAVDRELTVELAAGVALPELVLAVITVLVLVPVPVVTVLLEVTLSLV